MRNLLIPIFFFSTLLIGSPQILFSQSDMEPPGFAEKKLVIDNVSEWLREYYIFPEVAEECIVKMNEQLKAGAYDKDVNRPVDFVRLLNPDLLEVSNDKHLKVVALFGIEELEEEEVPILEKVGYNHFLKRGNYGFMNIGWKKDNIGYLEFRAFCSPDVAGEKVRSVMNFLSDMDALIIDLRSLVMGGKPEMVSLISGYFFEEPTLLNRTYFRKENITDENWSYQVEGIRFPPDIPLYILVNGNVFSAGEAFTYSLQALDRAIVIGERTGGGAHLTKSFRINNRFEAKIPWGRTINPVTGTNWEGTGVIPDFEVKSDTALEIAMEMASVEALKRREIREAKDEALVLKLLEQYKELKELYQKGYAEQATKTLDNLLNDGIYFGLLSEEMIDDFGYYLMENELLDLAFQCFQYNIDHFPESFTLAGYYYSLAEAYLEKEDSNQAIVCLKKSLEINPNDKWAEQLLKSIEQ